MEERPAERDVGIARVRQEPLLSHPAEAFHTGAAKKVEEKRFGIVAGMVGRQDGLVAMFPTQLAEPAVAELPRGHLDADPFLFRIGFRVERLHVAGHTMLGRPVADERLVGVAVGAPEVEVAMGNGKRSAFPANLFCQDHRVPATADGDEDHGLISCW